MSAMALTLFISYAHEDESFRRDLDKSLASLKREGLVEEWYDRMIKAGQDWDKEIHAKLDQSHIILLLISPDFMASQYCNEVETKRAMQKHEMGTARVIPVLLRPADWQGAPFSKLQATPTEARPISEWNDRDAAYLDVVQHLRTVCRELTATPGNPANPYVGAAVGDWYQAEIAVDVHMTGETKLGSMRLTLMEKNNQKAIIQAEIESADLDLHENRTVEVPLDKPCEDSMKQLIGAIYSEQIPANAALERRQTGAGTEKLFIGGKAYYTTWIAYEIETRVGRERLVQKEKGWMSSEIPLDGWVKGVVEIPGVMTQTMIVTDYGRGNKYTKAKPLTKKKISSPPSLTPPTLKAILIGRWNVQIGQPLGPAISAEFAFDARGIFGGRMMSPLFGMVSIQGQWQSEGQTLAMQGTQNAAVVNLPYSAMVTFNNVSSNKLEGISSAGERVIFSR